jgi:hypothetical protein
VQKVEKSLLNSIMLFRLEKYKRNGRTRRTRIYEDGRTNHDVSVETWIGSRPVELSIDNGYEQMMM